MKNGTTEQIRRLLRDLGAPVPIREIIDALPNTLDRHAIVRLIAKLRATGEVKTSLADGQLHYYLDAAYVPKRVSRAAATELPPAPETRRTDPSADAPTGPAPAATPSSPPRAPEAQAEPPAASDHAAAKTLRRPRDKTRAERAWLAANGRATPAVTGADFPPPGANFPCRITPLVSVDAATEVGALADDLTTVACEMAVDGTDPDAIANLIKCVANANRLAGLMRAGR